MTNKFWTGTIVLPPKYIALGWITRNGKISWNKTIFWNLADLYIEFGLK